MRLLANPWSVWKNGEIALKKTILRVVFKEPLAYCKENGFRTPQTSVIFRFLDKITEKCKMVRSERLELSRVLPHSDLNAARLPFRHDRTPWMVEHPIARVATYLKRQSAPFCRSMKGTRFVGFLSIISVNS